MYIFCNQSRTVEQQDGPFRCNLTLKKSGHGFKVCFFICFLTLHLAQFYPKHPGKSAALLFLLSSPPAFCKDPPPSRPLIGSDFDILTQSQSSHSSCIILINPVNEGNENQPIRGRVGRVFVECGWGENKAASLRILDFGFFPTGFVRSVICWTPLVNLPLLPLL